MRTDQPLAPPRIPEPERPTANWARRHPDATARAPRIFTGRDRQSQRALLVLRELCALRLGHIDSSAFLNAGGIGIVRAAL